ncbi:N-succinylarginine dihydrolase [Legionella londiniensis]|uniref:N-succinylarginine dihydrolase n=1 Tax=Legionella londiniensis TaxID=45068 RepID=A0A0W0VLX1_9GAMM|nr:N-succinylarginine dihydrolase [Legionella londiniensis]KTD21103.1 succinylarginine dihydrolase [Legionella londiniensis]STX93125.1 succinylarginine dihydrolase [Legionella londiniensis]
MNVYELNLDGLVGPSHHYAGLSAGNIASIENALTIANPKAAARQGLEKMRLIHSLGVKQALLPPHERPNLALLEQLGFTGKPEEQVRKAKKTDPNILSACYSASSMWTANAATVSASRDTESGKVQFTAANLVSNLHRHQEADFSHALLKRLFADETFFQHHPPLPGTVAMGDEGAANHSRICEHHHLEGLNLFVYGKRALPANNPFPAPKRFPARQTLEASEAIARRHKLNPEKTFFIAQNPAAIDLGVFHNDVIAVANECVLLVHEEAFLEQESVINALCQRADFPVHILQVPSKRISIEDAVKSYLFNSQLITLPNENSKQMVLIAPAECQQQPHILTYIDELISGSNPLCKAYFLNIKQSMQNGGGPACLRLRVPLTEKELCAMHQGILVNEALLDRLEAWVEQHYRSELHADDLDDPQLIHECYQALDELTAILQLGNIYRFQR